MLTTKLNTILETSKLQGIKMFERVERLAFRVPCFVFWFCSFKTFRTFVPDMEKNKLNGHIAIFSANLIFGLNNPISRTLMPEILSPYTLTFFRMSGGLLLFWIVSIFCKREHVPPRDILMLFFASFFALTLNQLPFFIGLSMTSPIDASIVVTMLPIVTMILAAAIIREPITLLKATGVLVGASGALLLVFTSHTLHVGKSNFWGNIIVFGATASFAIYLTVFKDLISRYSPVTVMKWMFLFGTFSCFPFCYKPIMQTDFTLLTSGTYWRIGYMVIFATFLGYLLIPIGQKILRPTTLSMYNYLQPVAASFLAVAIGIDTFGIEKAISGLLVFAGVYIVTRSKSRSDIEAEKASGIADKN
jgi:drug/metabolite transporter (DMT)-like permease